MGDEEEETDHNEQPRVGVDHLSLVAGLQVPEDGSIVEEGQVDHVLAFLKLGRVDPTDLSLRVNHLLVADADRELGGQVGALGANAGYLASTLKQPLPLHLDQHKIHWPIKKKDRLLVQERITHL